jgi:hypothetical protein
MMKTRSRWFRFVGAGVMAASTTLGCSSDEDADDGSGGDSGSGASGASAGSGGTGKAGSAGSNQAGTGAATNGGNAGNGASTGKGGSAGTADGGAGDGEAGLGGADSNGNAGSGGSAGTGNAGSAGSGGNPGECGAIQTFEDGLTPTRELFVDAAAAGPGDGSEADPYPNVEAALSAATPGTAVRIRPGTYAGGAFASGITGSATAPIWIGGVPGAARPLISGGANAIQLSASSYVILHDLEVTGQDSNGLNIDDGEAASGQAHHLIFRDLSIHDIGSGGNQDCLKLSGLDDYFVLDSEFVGCSGGSAVDHVGCHRGVVARNTFRDLGGNGVQSKGGSDDIEITQNTFMEAGQRAVNMGGSTGFEFFRPALSTAEPNFEARNIRVVANLFQGGISPIAFVGCVDCIAANNTVVDPVQWVARILQETTSADGYEFLPAAGGRFVNNIVYFARGELSTYVNVGPDTAPETFEFSNNLWFAYDSPGESEPDSLPVAENAGIYGSDPGFGDASSSDFSITAESPGAAAGIAVSGVQADLVGNCYSEPPSVGALEVAATP